MKSDTRLCCADCGREGSIMTITAGWSELAHIAAADHPFRLAPRSAHDPGRGRTEAPSSRIGASHPGPTAGGNQSARDVSPTASGGDDAREDPPFPRPVVTTGRRHRTSGNAQMGGQRSATGRA